MVAGEPAIVSFNGGTKDNAINRECKAVLVYADHAAAEAAAQIAKGIIADVTAELEVFDPGFTCTVEIADDAEVEAMDQKSALALIRALRLAPNGVIRRNVATDGSVEVSSNIGVVATSDDQVKIMLSPRSSITSLQNEFKDRLQTLADVLGFDAKFEFEYPGWSYAEHSPVRDVFVESYRELFGSELRIGPFTPALSAACLPRPCTAWTPSPWDRRSPMSTPRTRAWSSLLPSASTSCSSTSSSALPRKGRLD